MKVKDIILTEMLSAAIRDADFDNSRCMPPDIDWEEVYAEAVIHQVHTLVYPVIKNMNAGEGPGKELLEKWDRSVMSCGFRMICDGIWVGKVLEELGSMGIKTIVLKGMALNRYYRHPELRTMGDADILVREANMEKAGRILRSMGYTAERDRKTKHVEFHKKGCISIELHRLLADREFLENTGMLLKDAWDRPIPIKIGNAETLALSWEMQVLHLCVHMASHITYGGIGLRQLCDLVVVVENKGRIIDWNIVLEKSIEYGIDQFVPSIFSACHRLLGMELPPGMDTGADGEKVELLIEDILSGGNFGVMDPQRMSANVLLNNSKRSGGLRSGKKLIKAMRILFPGRKLMAGRYKYAYIRKNPLFLPVAWIHRIAHGIVRKDFNFQDKKAIFRDSRLSGMAEKRNDLLEWLGLR